MRERSKVARGADAALRRNDRKGVAIEEGLQRVDYERTHAGIASPETEQLKQDHQSRDVPRQRIAETGTVRQNEIGLEFCEPLVRDAGVRQHAEAGVHPVDGLTACDDAVDRGSSVGDALHRRVAELRFGA